MPTFIVIALLFVSSQSFASPRFESAQAYPGETYEQAQKRHEARHKRERPNFFEDVPQRPNDDVSRATSGSAYGHKQNFHVNIDVSLLPEWKTGAAKLEEAFQKIRDVRLYTDRSHTQFKRRATWLYPINGCYTRAAHMARGLERLVRLKPGKVFAFGTWATLRAKTPYAPNGKAWWSFHTAAAYRLGNRAMVLDPAVDPNRILPFEEWVGLIAPDPSKISVSICDGNAYSPSQTCVGGSNKQDYWAVDSLEGDLDDEWNSLVNLGLNPTKLLGDFPPWKKTD